MAFLTNQDLKTVLGGVYTDADDTVLTQVADAVCVFVARVRPDLDNITPPADVRYAALQLGLRWYDKRGSNLAASFSELGYIPGSVDKDVEMALQIGRYQGPVVA